MRTRALQISCLLAVFGLVLLSPRPAAAAVGFAATGSYPMGAQAVGLARADFNDDGRVDLATANATANTVSVMLGNGGGTFAPPVAYATGAGPQAVAAQDLNGDGKVDLVVADSLANTVSVLLGKGDGTFARKVDYATGVEPLSVTIDDFTSDGKPDLAVANYISGSVSVLVGAGDGTFASQGDFQIDQRGGAPGPVFITSADVTREGIPDLIVANRLSNMVSVSLASGDGPFPISHVYATGAAPSYVAVADLDDDGDPDLVVANQASNTISVILGRGDGTFAAKVDYRTGTAPTAVALADFDGDNKTDVAVANGGSGSVSLLLGKGDGTFASKVDFSVGSTPTALTAIDLNGDNKRDLLVGDGLSQAICVLQNISGKPAPNVDIDTPRNGALSNSPVRFSGVGGVALGDEPNVVVKIWPGSSVGAGAPLYSTSIPVVRAPVNDPRTGQIDPSSGLYFGTGPFTRVSDSALLATLPDGTYTARAFQSDSAGNTAQSDETPTFTIDTQAPSTTDDVPAGYVDHDVTVTLTPKDSGSAVSKTYYSTGAAPPDPTVSSPVYNASNKPVLRDGERIKYFSVDRAGNTERVEVSAPAMVDTRSPSTTDDVPASYVSHDVTVTLSANDAGSGVDKTFYEVGAHPADPTANSPVYDAAHKPVLHDGERIKYYSLDKAGNAEPIEASAAAKVDTAPPETSATAPSTSSSPAIRVDYAASDVGGSGLDSVALYVRTPGAVSFSKAAVDSSPSSAGHFDYVADAGEGQYSFYTLGRDRAGNAEAVPASPTAATVLTASGLPPSEPDTPHVDPPPHADKPPTVRMRRAVVDRKKKSARFTFSATPVTGSRFECALVKVTKHPGLPRFASCASPKTYKKLRSGRYAFDVRARSSVGVGRTVTKTFKI